MQRPIRIRRAIPIYADSCFCDGAIGTFLLSRHLFRNVSAAGLYIGSLGWTFPLQFLARLFGRQAGAPVTLRFYQPHSSAHLGTPDRECAAARHGSQTSSKRQLALPGTRSSPQG
jgi:hypothetical protein